MFDITTEFYSRLGRWRLGVGDLIDGGDKFRDMEIFLDSFASLLAHEMNHLVNALANVADSDTKVPEKYRWGEMTDPAYSVLGVHNSGEYSVALLIFVLIIALRINYGLYCTLLAGQNIKGFAMNDAGDVTSTA